MSTVRGRGLCLLVALALVAAACGGNDSSDDASPQATGSDSPQTTVTSEIDYSAVGLWDDGPCDETLPPLIVGTSSVFESPVLSLVDQALGLEAAAEAFNDRGGANGACIEVHTCDDGADFDKALACVRELDAAGIVATVNEITTTGTAEVAAALSEAGIPRVATNVSPSDWGDPNAFPIDASATGFALLIPQAIIEQGVTDIGVVRADLAEASALTGILADIYEDEGATFPLDVPVPAGTTDYTQFILAAQEAGVGGILLAMGENEALQVVRAGEKLGGDLLIGVSLGGFTHAKVAEFGDFAKQMVFLTSFSPATVDLPVYEVLRADLAASGEERLQPPNIKETAVRSWIGLYALIEMIREAKMTEFTRDGITALLQEAKDVPMLGMFAGEDWTPDRSHAGAFERAGIDNWGIYRWDPQAEAPDGLEGNFVESAVISFDDVLCGSPFGAPEPC